MSKILFFFSKNMCLGFGLKFYYHHYCVFTLVVSGNSQFQNGGGPNLKTRDFLGQGLASP